MIPKVVTVPIRIGLTVTRTTLGLSTKLAGAAAGTAFHIVQSRFTAPQPTRSTPAKSAPAKPAPAKASPAEPTPAETAANTVTPTPPAPSTVPASSAPAEEQSPVASAILEDLVAPDEQPDTPLTPEEAHAKTIDDTDEVVAEFAESGAEDGAGAQLHLEEPWEGYDSENADAIAARIAEADAAQLALLELYEQVNKQRKTVLDAAARRLKELSPPNAS